MTILAEILPVFSARIESGTMGLRCWRGNVIFAVSKTTFMNFKHVVTYFIGLMILTATAVSAGAQTTHRVTAELRPVLNSLPMGSTEVTTRWARLFRMLHPRI